MIDNIPPNPWKRVSRTEQKLFDFMSFMSDEVIFPDGKTGKYYFVSMIPCAVLVPEVEPGKFVMAGQWRYPTQRFSWEFPMGGALKRRETPEEYEQDAIRECFEETGYRAKNATYLGTFYGANAGNDQPSYIFSAQDLVQERVLAANDPEVQKVQIFSLEEIMEMILASEIRDSFTIVSLFHYLHRKTRV